MIGALDFALRGFDELNTRELYALLRLRQEVFVIEQHCAYLDADGIDLQSWHLLGRDEQGALRAYLRIVPPGLKYTEPSIGRVISAGAVRGSGAGRALMVEGVAHAGRLFPGLGLRISAQARLQRFYEGFGFVAEGAEYLEDNIPHVEMARRP
ncbi:GNAT family N-acetyltransferase [Rivibacter subsaxonicus]|uniref:ElaA protein n=1 Tax=Rivibacter subsaxonicus TaxID=457575 RepID=A0A4Q7W1N1_9BURK|nr:GNAT family N-acetyltransferase [Rivibacter subsaxonicus]RZU02745.1 ElaA protein [Rivibacter subsaxonicus]